MLLALGTTGDCHSKQPKKIHLQTALSILQFSSVNFRWSQRSHILLPSQPSPNHRQKSVLQGPSLVSDEIGTRVTYPIRLLGGLFPHSLQSTSSSLDRWCSKKCWILAQFSILIFTAGLSSIVYSWKNSQHLVIFRLCWMLRTWTVLAAFC